MRKKWLKEELNKLFQSKNVVVVIDKSGEYKKVLEDIVQEEEYQLLKVKDFVDDLEVKYRIEKDDTEKKIIIHSYINPQKKDKWQFMIQEYIATREVFKQPLSKFIKEKSGLQDADINLTDEQIRFAGYISDKIEDSKAYWEQLKQKGLLSIFGDYIQTILEFLHNPDDFLKDYPEPGREILYEIMGKDLKRQIDLETDPKVLAQEYAFQVFESILHNKKKYREIYKRWSDSVSYKKSLQKYLNKFELPEDIDPWQIDYNHPFAKIDKIWLDEIKQLIIDNEEMPKTKKKAIQKRARSKVGIKIADSIYWQDIHDLLNCKLPVISEIEDVHDFVEVYKSKIYKIDTAFRHLNRYFLEDQELLRCFRMIYEERLRPYVNKWFDLIDTYSPNQQNYLSKRIFKDDESYKAVIVGDALSFEVSQEIRSRIRDDFNVTTKIINGDYPTTTQNNMSSLFGSIITDKRKKREEALQGNLEKQLQVYELDTIDFAGVEPSNPTIIYGSDVDTLSEEGNEKALKYYDTFISETIKTIHKLFETGFSEVHIVTDHGFVLNFMIDEADKYNPNIEGKKRERYILSDERKELANFIRFEKSVQGYKYIYFPRGLNPVKSKGRYGFSHGGITPQEILLPHLIFKMTSRSYLKVKINNKEDLKTLSSSNVNIQLKAESATDLFKQSRKIQLKIIAEGETVDDNYSIEPGDTFKKTYTIIKEKFEVQILDYSTKEIIDKVKCKKDIIRRGIDELDSD